MNSKTPNLDPAFLQSKRHRLVELRGGLEITIQAGRSREGAVNGQSVGEAQEYEDDAQRLALLEVDGTLIWSHFERLVQVKRALQKLEEGTYGVSDRSGALISRDRLVDGNRWPNVAASNGDSLGDNDA
jgi:DnaK suppressor protein